MLRKTGLFLVEIHSDHIKINRCYSLQIQQSIKHNK